MYDFLMKLFDALPEDMAGEKGAAAPSDLFKTDFDDCEPLDDKKRILYRKITASALYAGIRARPDVQLATSFHSARIREPGQHGWRKLCMLPAKNHERLIQVCGFRVVLVPLLEPLSTV